MKTTKADSLPVVGRQPRQKVKQDQVVERLRQGIFQGRLSGRLPRQAVLARRFGVSRATMTAAIARLKHEGFLSARQKTGTLVHTRLPHLHNLALVLPTAPDAFHYWSRHYAALVRQAQILEHGLDRSITIFHDVANPLSPERQRLIHMIQTQQLAGVIFPSGPFYAIGTPILDHPGVPRVALTTDHRLPSITVINMVPHSFVDKAVRYMADCGRRRIAFIGLPLSAEEDRHVDGLLQKGGMKCPPAWRLGLSLEFPVSARNCARLLMYADQKARPDGLVILDDNLVDDAVAGLVAERIRVPEDLEVVAHCNFPWPEIKVMPVKRIGLDTRGFLLTAIDLIDRQRRGESVPPMTMIEPIWEDELSSDVDIPAAARHAAN